jgi:L-ascorbate metabolism protein UlaG (beta-lactamase superfamily)
MAALDRILDIYYLGHSGFAADTKNKLLIFDYWEDARMLLAPVIGIKNRKVFFFSSHDHHDHYDKAVERYKKDADTAAHFTGWDMHDKGHVYISPHNTIERDGVSTTALKSNDSGAAFLVRTDEACIFHGGDLAGWEDESWASFSSEIGFLKELNIKIDIAFLAVTTFSGIMQKTMIDAARYFIDTVKPRFFIPMHANAKEYLYQVFKDRYYPGDSRIIYPRHPGEKIAVGIPISDQNKKFVNL